MPKKKPVTPENMRALALDVMKYLQKQGIFEMTNIYAGGMHYSSDRHPGLERHEGPLPGECRYEGPCDKVPCEYSNPETLTMTFEGPLYHAMNYGTYVPSAYDDLDRILARYGLYLEMGYAWSLSAWPE